jgi:hypothetical protein
MNDWNRHRAYIAKLFADNQSWDTLFLLIGTLAVFILIGFSI